MTFLECSQDEPDVNSLPQYRKLELTLTADIPDYTRKA